MRNNISITSAPSSISRFLRSQAKKFEENILFGRSLWVHSLRKLIRLPFHVHSTKYPQPEISGQRASGIHGDLAFENYLRLCMLKYSMPEGSFVITCVTEGGDCSSLRTLMKAVSESPGITLNILNAGPGMEECRYLLRRMKILNIHIYTGLSQNRVRHFYQNSSMLLFHAGNTSHSGLHPRQLEMLATGLPLLLIGDQACEAFLNSFENVFQLKGKDPIEFRRRIQLFSALPICRSYSNISRIGYAYLDQFEASVQKPQKSVQSPVIEALPHEAESAEHLFVPDPN
jgi:hypothetical protein